jgi:nicotinamidase-related amidase
LIVHMQNDVLSPAGPYAAPARDGGVIARIGRLAHAARAAGLAVVYARLAFQPDYRDLVANSEQFARVARDRRFTEGSHGAAIIDDLAPRDGDVVVTHQRMSALVASPLDPLLRHRGIGELAICGIATNVSIEGSARSAVDLGYRVTVIDDACCAAAPTSHAASIANLSVMASVAPSRAVMAAWAHGLD